MGKNIKVGARFILIYKDNLGCGKEWSHWGHTIEVVRLDPQTAVCICPTCNNMGYSYIPLEIINKCLMYNILRKKFKSFKLIGGL